MKGDVAGVTDSLFSAEYVDDFISCESYELNEDGQPVTITGYDEIALASRKTTLQWKDKTTKLSETEYMNDRLWSNTAYEYDKKGRPVKETKDSPEYNMREISVYTYSDEDNSYEKTTTQTYPDGDTSVSSLRYYVDSRGRTVREVDIENDLETSYQYGEDGLLQRETFSRRATFNKEEHHLNSSESIDSFLAEKFSWKKNIKEATTQDEENVYVRLCDVTAYDYTFDDNGNWVERNERIEENDLYDKNPVRVQRTITYKK